MVVIYPQSRKELLTYAGRNITPGLTLMVCNLLSWAYFAPVLRKQVRVCSSCL